MTSVEEIKKKLDELHCSVLQFAKLTNFPQPRLWEALSGKRELGPYQTKFFLATLAEMTALQAAVREHLGAPVVIVWNHAAWQSMEHRRATGKGDFGVGVKYPKPEPETFPEMTRRVLRDREQAEASLAAPVLAGQLLDASAIVEDMDTGRIWIGRVEKIEKDGGKSK